MLFIGCSLYSYTELDVSITLLCHDIICPLCYFLIFLVLSDFPLPPVSNLYTARGKKVSYKFNTLLPLSRFLVRKSLYTLMHILADVLSEVAVKLTEATTLF